MKQSEEVITLIAKRQPPGDQWRLESNKNLTDLKTMEQAVPIVGLTNVLTQYMRKTGFKGAYRLEPLNGELYAIETVTHELPDPEPVVWDLYGEEA